MKMTEYHRYAIYAAPRSGTPLGRLGDAWLGRNCETGERIPRPNIPGYNPSEIAAFAETPARYGFHGTIVAPFRPTDDIRDVDLIDAVQALAEALSPVSIPGFDVRSLGRFVAIVPEVANDGMATLSRRCVEDMAQFRAPMSDAEWNRRIQAGLTPNQERLLSLWGYPYVMEEYRFHLTLTGSLDAVTRAQLCEDITDYASAALGPHTFEDLALFAEPEPGAEFKLIRRFPLAAAAYNPAFASLT